MVLDLSHEPLAEQVGCIEFANGHIGVDQQISEFAALKAGTWRELRIGARRRWLVAPGVSDRGRKIGSQLRPDRRRLVAVLTRSDIEFGNVASESVHAALELVVGRFHIGNHEAEHDRGERHEDRNDEPNVVSGPLTLVLLGELALETDAYRACAEERAENADNSGTDEHSASSLAPNGLARVSRALLLRSSRPPAVAATP